MRMFDGFLCFFGGTNVLGESMAALSAAAGAAVVQAAGTDAWISVRGVMRRVLGGRDEDEGIRSAARLDAMAAELAAPSALQERERVQEWWTRVWRERLEILLESLPEEHRAVAAADLRGVLEQARQRGSVAGGIHVESARDVSVRAAGGSVAGAAVTVEGGIHLSSPLPPRRQD
ncbi:hypothetical protein [Streptomyces sp. FZ201]|uniref:hypothetical protein n=1 Tax=Streptomyces sp. FZ201 TaxID=3057122 RepID=UPI0021BF8FB5|nr:hypothetical protein [Streptomyces sp. FZ201]